MPAGPLPAALASLLAPGLLRPADARLPESAGAACERLALWLAARRHQARGDLAAARDLLSQVRHPALLVLASGVDPTRALVLSQVVLSFGIPFALVPLIRLTGDRALMGADVNHPVTSALGWLVAALITVLNAALIYLTVT